MTDMRIKTVILTSLLLALVVLPGAVNVSDEVARNVTDFNDDSLGLHNPETIHPESAAIISAIPTSTTGSGTLLAVEEYAEGTILGRSSKSNESTTFYPQVFEIPAGWSTSSVTAVSSEIYHVKNWIINSDFSDITNWYQQEDDPPGVLTESYDSVNDWICITRVQGGKVKYDHWGSWNQTVIVNEGGVVTAQLSISFMITTSTGANGQNARPYAFVNGTLYELPTGGARFSSDQDWTTYTIDLPIERYVFPGVLEVAVGIQGFVDTQFQTTAVLYCDDILLTMRTSRLSEVIDLKARDKNDPSNVVPFTTGAEGKGYAQLSGSWDGQIELEFLANETGTEFTCDLEMPITKETQLLTNTYTVAAGNNASWLSEFTAREMPYPFSYRHFNVSIPRDWVVDFVYDPYGDVQLVGTTYYNASYDGSTSLLTCDVAGTGPTGTPHYGTWRVLSTSPNYGSSISFLGDSGGSWVPTSIFYANSPLRVDVTFLDSSDNPPTTEGAGILTLYDNEGFKNYEESGGSLDPSGTHLYQNGTGSANITIDPYWLAGPVTAIASWGNGTAVGEIRSEFYINHRTTLEVESAYYAAYRGDLVTIRVRFVDAENGLGIAGGSMWFSWTHGSGTMGYAGNGWYAGAVDTSMAPIGSYIVTTNASKAYYDYSEISGITIETQEKTTLYSPKDLKTPTTEYEIAWGNSRTIYLAYEDTISMNPLTMSAEPGSPSSPDPFNTYTSNNVYTTVTSVGDSLSLTVETDVDSYSIVPEGLTALSFKIEGRFSTTVTGSVSAYNFSSSSWVLVVESYSPLIDTTLTWKTSKPTDFISGTGVVRARIDASAASSFTYSLDFFAFVAFRPVSDAALGISMTSDWPAQSGVGTQIGPVYNPTLRIWQVTLNTAGVTPGEYVVLIEASATGHQSRTLELTITVRAHHTRVTAPPPAETPWGWKTWITVSIADIDNASVVIPEDDIVQIEVTSSYGTQIFTSSSWVYSVGSGRATIGLWLDTSQWAVARYNLTISVSSAGSGVTKSFDDGNTELDLVIREHDTRVTVLPPSETPWGWSTSIRITLQDLDNMTLIDPSNVSQIVIAGQVVTTWEYSSGIYTCLLDTSSWAIGQGTYAVSVITTSDPKLYTDGSSDVQVTIRSHNIQLFVLTPSPTPWGLNTTLIIEILDLDNITVPVPEDNLSSLQVGSQVFTSSDWLYEDKGTYAQLTITLVTYNWPIEQQIENAITLFTSGSGSSKYYSQAEGSVYITVRRHNLLITVLPPTATPWGNDTIITINLIDLDLQSLKVPESNITSIVIGGQVFTSGSWTYLDTGTYATITVVYSTSGLAVGTYLDISVLLTTTGAGASKFFTDASSDVDISVRAHGTSLQVHPIPATPWGTTTSVSFTLNDLDHTSSYVAVEEISYLWISGVIYTSTNFTYSDGVLTIILDTSGYGIGTWPMSVEIVFAGMPKNYTSATSSLTITITSHTISVEALRPQATPWAENTTITIRVRDISTPTNVISSDNVTQIIINGVIITSWVYDNGNFTVVLDTDGWAVGTYYSLSVSIVTAQSVAKFYLNGATSVTIEIRNRYTEAYSPASPPVPYPDDLVFTITFRDRDADRALVNLTKIHLNGSIYTEGVDYSVQWISLGTYQVTFHTSGLVVGEYTLIATCEREGFESATTYVRFVIRVADTSATASGYNFNAPLEENVTLTIQFRDVDRSVNIVGATVVCDWAEGYVVTDIESDGVYEITLITWDSTMLGTYSVQFILSKTNYATTYVTITLKVSTHATFLSYDEAVVATGVGANITVAMFYEDLSLGIGIGNSSGNVLVSIYNAQNTSAIFFVEENSALGVGHYLILIPANQFGGIGYQDFVVYFNWTGSLKYYNLTKSFTVEIRGTDTDLVVAVSPPPIYYGDLVNFTLLYKVAESGSGITNSSGDIIGYAALTTPGQTISSSDFYILEVSATHSPGRYRIILDSSLLTNWGEFTIRVWFNCSPSSSLLYQNQTLDITVTVLIRTTLLDITPPQNTAFDEQAVFTFAYYDSPTNTKIENSSEISVTIANPGLDYVTTYNTTTRTWTIFVDTSSLGSVGSFSLQLHVRWSGAPFYQNQTRGVSLTVTERPSQLTYMAPTPTFYSSNATIIFTYIDLIDDSSLGLSGSSLVLTSPGLTLLGSYTVIDNGDGTYSVELNSTAFNEPGTHLVTATITYSGLRFVRDASVSFAFKVMFRAVVATVEPAGSVAWQSDIVLTLHVTDGETGTSVFNVTGGVRIGLGYQNSSSPGIEGVTVVWQEGTDTYTLIISNTLSVGTHLIYLNVSYDYTSPYYGYKVVSVSVTIRRHSTELQLSEAPERTGYGLISSFRLYYVDLDTDSAIGSTVLVVQNASLAGYWNIVPYGDGYYTVEIDTSAFPSLGTFWIRVVTQNTGPLENYQNTAINVKVYVRERYTSLTYDPIAATSYTANVTIVVYYVDSDSGYAGIDNSTYPGALRLTTNASVYYVSDGTSPGSFVIEMPASQFTPFVVTDLRIEMQFTGSPFFQNKMIIVNFQVRGTATNFAWDPSSPVPFGDVLNLTFYWGDSDSGLPVSAEIGVDMAVEIACITQPSLDTSNPAIVSVLQAMPTATHARFYLLVNTSYLAGVDTYVFTITLRWVNADLAPYYESQIDRVVSAIVRVRNTAVPQITASPVFYGEGVTILLQYVDLDANSQLITGGSLTIAVLDGVSYTVNYTPTVDGFYEIYVPTTGTSFLGSIRFNLTVIWSGAPYYKNQTAVNVVAAINARIANLEIDYPVATPYLDNVVFTIRLQDTHTLEWMNNNASSLYVAFILPLGATGDFDIVPLGDGRYQIVFNTTDVGQIGQYKIRLVFNHSYYAPYYTKVTRDITGSVTMRATSLDYEPITAVPYGDMISFNLTYLDADASSPIASATVNISCSASIDELQPGVNYWVTYKGDGVYQIDIDTAALGAPQSYGLSIVVNSAAEWWLSQRTRSVSVSVDYRRVEMVISSPDSVYYDDISYFLFTLTDLDADTPLSGMTGYFSVSFTIPAGVNSSTVVISEVGAGVYNVSFDTGILNQLSDYRIMVSFTYGQSADYWRSVSGSISGRVQERPTQLSYEVDGRTPYLDNVTITLHFEDIDTTQGVNGAVITASSGLVSLEKDSNYWVFAQSDGYYVLLIASTAFGDIGHYTVSVAAEYYGTPYYTNKTRLVTAEVRERATRLTYTLPTETPYGNNVSFLMTLADVDDGLSGITGVEDYFTLVSVNGTPIDSSYYWILSMATQGTYRLQLNTSKLETFGHLTLNITVSGMTFAHYQSQIILVEADVRERNTQLTTAPISQTPYTNNATVTLYFIDKDANIGVTNATGGVLVAVNTTIGWWVTQTSPGVFVMKMNVTQLGSDGQFGFQVDFSWINGRPFYASRSIEFVLTVTGSTAVLSYTPPDDVPIGETIVFSVSYKDASTGDGISNASGNVHITLTTLNATPAGSFQYWVQNPSSGVFVFTINSTPFWAIGPLYFQLNVTWTHGILPYYPDINGTTIRAVIRAIYTQTLADAPDPGTVPAGDEVTLVIGYYDLDHEAFVETPSLDTDWPGSWSYTVLGDGRFNITFQTAGVPTIGKHTVLITFTKMFHLSKTASVTITIRLIATTASSTYPDPPIVPVGDTVTLEVSYTDIDHAETIQGALIETSWSYGWSWIEEADGVFSVTLYTAGVTNLIEYTVFFTLSKAGHQTSQISVKFTIRQIRTAITVDVPSRTVAGSNVTVTVTIEDLDHNVGVEGATILTNAPSGTYSVTELSGGTYTIEYFLWESGYGTYNYDITGLKSLYQSASTNIDINIVQVKTTISLSDTIHVMDWGQDYLLVVHYERDDYPEGPVIGANVTAEFGSYIVDLTFNGTTYNVLIDTSLLHAGTYLVTVRAEKADYESRIQQMTMVVAILQTTLVNVDGVYSYSIVSGQSIALTVYYEADAYETGVDEATVAFSWDYGSGDFAPNGTAGFYTVSINTTGAYVNVYTLYVRANRTNHAEASIYLSINVQVIDTELIPIGPATVEAVYGESVPLTLRYHSPTLLENITGASISFRFSEADYTGTLSLVTPGIYSADIDTTLLSSGSFTVYVTATKAGYKTATVVILLQVGRIDTQVTTPDLSVILVYEQMATLYFNYTDTHYGLPVENATLEYRWQGGTGVLEEMGDGIYRGAFDSRSVGPGLFYLYVTASKTNYKQAVTSVPIQVERIATEIIVSTVFDTPVGDSLTIYIYFNDTTFNRPVVNALGTAQWIFGNPVLNETSPGNYSFTLPNDVAIGSYSLTLILSKANHTTSTEQITVIVRPIRTELTIVGASPYISTTMGSLVTMTVLYMDLDHNVPIMDASIDVTQAQQILREGDWSLIDGSSPGEYVIRFFSPVDHEFNIVVHASLGENYETQDLTIVIVSVPAVVDPVMTALYMTGSLGLILSLVAALLYVKVFSVPKRIRQMNRMIKKLSKGKVPEAPEVSDRKALLAGIINEGLAPMKIGKPLDEIPTETVELQVPETEDLLVELGELIGLTEQDLDALRKDLFNMRPSERPGFLNEVIKQERARRAEEVDEKKKKKGKREATKKVTPEELEDIRQRLLKMDIAPEEVELMLENAKGLTRAEIDSLLDSIEGPE